MDPHVRVEPEVAALTGRERRIGAKERLRSVVTYDVAADKWSVLPEGCEMQRARAVPGCCFSPCGGFLYAVGGSDGESKLNSAERFGAQDMSPLCTVSLRSLAQV